MDFVLPGKVKSVGLSSCSRSLDGCACTQVVQGQEIALVFLGSHLLLPRVAREGCDLGQDHPSGPPGIRCPTDCQAFA